MKKILLAGIAAAAFCGAPAFAADMPTKGPVYAPAFSWTGCYVGGNAGWIGSRDRYDLSPSGNYLTPAGGAPPPNAGGTGLLAGDIAIVSHIYDPRDSGFTGGVQTGCNKQTGSIVFGVEGDFNFSNLNSKVNATYLPTASANPAFTISAQTDQVSTKPDWFSTFRGRFGIAIDRLLIYGTGGLAEVHIKSTTNVSFGPGVGLPVLANAVHIGSNSFTKIEGVVGAGAEYAFNNNWSAKIEYLHVGLGHFGYNSPLTAPAGVAPGYSWRTAAHFQDNIIRVGLNYRFGGDPWGKAPVSAKY